MNRRIRNRTYGGVGGRQGQPCLLPDVYPLFILVISLAVFHIAECEFYIAKNELSAWQQFLSWEEISFRIMECNS